MIEDFLYRKVSLITFSKLLLTINILDLHDIEDT